MSEASPWGRLLQVPTPRGIFAARLFGLTDPEQTAIAPQCAPTAGSPPFPPLIVFVHGAGMSSMSIARCASILLTGRSSGGNGSGGIQRGLAPGAIGVRAPLPAPPAAAASFGFGAAVGSGAGDDGPFPIRTLAIDLRFHGETLNADGCGAASTGLLAVPPLTPALSAMLASAQNHGNPASGPGAEPATAAPVGDEGDELHSHLLAAANLVEDVAGVIDVALREHFAQTPRVFLVGHSLGGQIVCRVAHHALIAPRVGGVVVVDVVEGTARAALRSMGAFLDRRPSGFATIDKAVQWFVREGGMRNADSARVVVPSLLHDTEAIESGAKSGSNDKRFVWRTNLRATMPFWEGWFADMDAEFIRIPAPKMLLVASVDRLDTDLTVAQMQGKFQFEVVGSSNVGHYVLEDDPALAAAKLQRFVKRIDTLMRKLPPVQSAIKRH